jgi:hypothetical protein
VLSCETLRSSVCSRPSFDHIKEHSGKRRCGSSPVVHQCHQMEHLVPAPHSGRDGLVIEGAVSHGLIIRLIIQTIRRDPSGSDQIDEAPDVSRPDPSGADQIDAEHQATDLAVGGSNPSRRATKIPAQRPVTGSPTGSWPPDCDHIATTLAGTANRTATTCDHYGPCGLHCCCSTPPWRRQRVVGCGRRFRYRPAGPACWTSGSAARRLSATSPATQAGRPERLPAARRAGREEDSHGDVAPPSDCRGSSCRRQPPRTGDPTTTKARPSSRCHVTCSPLSDRPSNYGDESASLSGLVCKFVRGQDRCSDQAVGSPR